MSRSFPHGIPAQGFYVPTRLLALLALVLLLQACSSPDKEGMALDSRSAAPREAITDGSLSDAGLYQDDEAAKAAAPPPGTQADLVVNVGDRIFFDTDSYSLSPEARQTLDAQATWLRQYPNVTIIVEGHADERGTREYNLALGERRANAVRNYLSAFGLAPLRVNTVSYGKERPAAPGANEAAWLQNRRAVTKVN